MCCALLLLLLSIVELLLVCCTAAFALLPHHQNSLGLTPKSPPSPHVRQRRASQTSSPVPIPPFTTPPRHLPLPQQSPPNPPSVSSPLHPTHPSCLKREWLDEGFRVTGQRVFCAYSRRPSCISCIPRVDPQSTVSYYFLHFPPVAWNSIFHFSQYDGTKQSPMPFVPHLSSIASSKVVSSFIRGVAVSLFFPATRVVAIGGVFDCRGIYHPVPASAFFLGRDPEGRDEVICGWCGRELGSWDLSECRM
ncbi:hypothetical protein N431DRAFT_86884 [Stipitochalara longipes BDJ]|nr:hypothetical protein N431DRAFT_86884 [Stipitochalara longipes BDJ]